MVIVAELLLVPDETVLVSDVHVNASLFRVPSMLLMEIVTSMSSGT